jgi:hypothetical protein
MRMVAEENIWINLVSNGRNVDRVCLRTGCWGEYLDKRFTNLLMRSSTGVIRMGRSRWMRLAGHVAQMREKKNARRLAVRKAEGKRRLISGVAIEPMQHFEKSCLLSPPLHMENICSLNGCWIRGLNFIAEILCLDVLGYHFVLCVVSLYCIIFLCS